MEVVLYKIRVIDRATDRLYNSLFAYLEYNSNGTVNGLGVKRRTDMMEEASMMRDIITVNTFVSDESGLEKVKDTASKALKALGVKDINAAKELYNTRNTSLFNGAKRAGVLSLTDLLISLMKFNPIVVPQENNLTIEEIDKTLEELMAYHDKVTKKPFLIIASVRNEKETVAYSLYDIKNNAIRTIKKDVLFNSFDSNAFKLINCTISVKDKTITGKDQFRLRDYVIPLNGMDLDDRSSIIEIRSNAIAYLTEIISAYTRLNDEIHKLKCRQDNKTIAALEETRLSINERV